MDICSTNPTALGWRCIVGCLTGILGCCIADVTCLSASAFVMPSSEDLVRLRRAVAIPCCCSHPLQQAVYIYIVPEIVVVFVIRAGDVRFRDIAIVIRIDVFLLAGPERLVVAVII